MKSIFLFLSALLQCAGLAAEPPRLLPFQGRLTDAAGLAVPDGPKLIQFQVYAESSGGSALWAGEVHRTTVNGGLVNVMLGSKNPLPQNRADDPNRSFFDATLYLQITVDGNSDGKIDQADPPLLPRQAILPVLFARDAANAQKAANSDKLGGFDWSALLGVNNPQTGQLQGGRIAVESIDISRLASAVAGALVPVGAIIAFAGPANAVPPGWILCDGSDQSKTTYRALWEKIRDNWGRETTTTFRMPDLRGHFLRGAANGAGADPDRGTRTDPYGAHAGDRVGSYQADTFAGHNHSGETGGNPAIGGTDFARDYNFSAGPGPVPSLSYHYLAAVNNLFSQHKHAIPMDGGSETRPKNAAVNYIIKY